MNRAPLALLALAPAVLYASAEGARSVGPWGIAAFLGFAAAVVPIAGFLRPELAGVAWLPGLFLGGLLFTISGISVNPLPGPLGDLTGGWAIGAPLFAASAALLAERSVGRRLFFLLVALLAGAAVLAIVGNGPTVSLGSFAEAFAQVPKEQALALASVLTGGASTGAPFLATPVLPYDALALLAGAGGLAVLLAVDPDREPEGLGHEAGNPAVPEGLYRSLLVEGRTRLAEATPSERPRAADPLTLVSVMAAAILGVGALVGASLAPSWLLPGTVVVVIVLLAAALLSLRFPRRSAAGAPATAPRAAGVTAPTERL